MDSVSLCLKSIQRSLRFSKITSLLIEIMAMQAGTVYRWILVEAATMKWMHLSFHKPGCMMGLYSRDANYVNEVPRMTDNIVFAAANRQVHHPKAGKCALFSLS